MLRRAILLLMVNALLVTFSLAQNSAKDDQKTNGLLNGRFWNSANEPLKLGFTIGYCEAAPSSLVVCPKQSNYGEIMAGIDRFYQEPENMRLPVFVALKVFALRVAGAEATEIEAVMDSARKYADKPQPPK